MNSNDLLTLAGVISLPVSAVLAVAWWAARAEVRQLRETTRHLIERDERTVTSRQLAQTVDALALDVERLAEGQRFVARLLERATSDRPAADRAQPLSPPRVITPH